MNRSPVARFALVTVLALSLGASGCELLKDQAGGLNLDTVVQSVSALAGEASSWSSSLSGLLTDAQMQQLGSFSEQANGLLSSLKGLGAGEGGGMKLITDGLAQLSGFDVDELLAMGQDGRADAASSFGDIAAQLSQAASDYLANG
jgi:hypothetical protein